MFDANKVSAKSYAECIRALTPAGWLFQTPGTFENRNVIYAIIGKNTFRLKSAKNIHMYLASAGKSNTLTKKEKRLPVFPHEQCNSNLSVDG